MACGAEDGIMAGTALSRTRDSGTTTTGTLCEGDGGLGEIIRHAKNAEQQSRIAITAN